MPRVLIVDDEGRLRSTVGRMLERAGHCPDLAANVDQAFRLATERPFDVAIVDYHLGESTTGIAVLKRLRELQPGCLRVLMSGRLDLPTIIDAINHGEVHRVIRKPFSARDLNETVDAVLASREAMRKLIRVTEEAVGQQQRTHLEECLDGGFVKLAVQPIVDAQTTRPVAYEALLRSKHPVMDGPLPVLAAAERHDMLGDLSRAVIARAAEWLSRLDDNVKLFMNVHPNELADGDAFLERLAPLVPQSHRVVLEITERNRLGGITEWERVVESLTQAGFQLAVDDLGAGYSSLAVLAELQPAYVKVDMSIVRNIDTDTRKRRLVDLLCRFADATGATLVAEGVETQAEADALKECGAHLLQGYFFGRPTLEGPSGPTAQAAR